jgi:hypothetical protein
MWWEIFVLFAGKNPIIKINIKQHKQIKYKQPGSPIKYEKIKLKTNKHLKLSTTKQPNK